MRTSTALQAAGGMAVALAAGARPALAHEGLPPAPHDLGAAWAGDPSVLLALVLAAGLYARGLGRAGRRRGWRVAAYTAGLGAVAVALASPLAALSTALFAAHMAQHLLLVQVAAPLLVLGTPHGPCLRALPRPWRRLLGSAWRRAADVPARWGRERYALLAWALSAVTLGVWHLPDLYQPALASAPLHAAEHISLLGAALLFWGMALAPGRASRPGHAAGALAGFGAALYSGILGILITSAPVPWYPVYATSAAAWNLTPHADQQLAGLLMWVLGGLLYVLAACGLLVAWLQATERAVRHREAAEWSLGPRA